MASLASVANTQLSGLTRRRVKYPVNEMLLSQIPAARATEQNRLTNLYRKEALKQDADQAAATLAQNADQFNKTQALNREISSIQEDQADKSAKIQGANTVISLAALTKDTWLPVVKDAFNAVKSLLPNTATPAATAGNAITNATPAVTEAVTPAVEATTQLGSSTGSTLADLAAQRAAEQAVAQGAANTAAPVITEAAAEGATGLTATESAATLPEGLTATSTEFAGTEGATGLGGTAASEAPATTSLSSVAGPVAIITAAEMVKGKFGGMDKQWEERDNVERLTSAPGTAGAFGPIGTVAMLADEDTFLGKLGKEAARAEQIVMAPIDALLGIKNVFCFAAGTPVSMDDGTTKRIEDIDLLEKCAVGGIVTGQGVALAADLYNYGGVYVTGSHAVLENGQWVRVEDSAKAISLDVEGLIKVYIINNANHILMINGITFADFGEVTDSENMTARQRLEYLNEHCKIQ